MSTIAERIIMVVESTGGNKSEFARVIGVTPAYISKLGKEPDRIPSDRTIKDICDKFAVSEHWLRTGEGEMCVPRSREEEIEDMVSRALSGTNEFKRAVIRMICTRTESELEALEKMLWQIVENMETAEKKPLHVIKIAGRDGSYEERTLTDDEMTELMAKIDALPDVPENL